MVRKRKNDPDKDRQGNSPRQPRPEETSKSTAEDMQYVSNSRSRARLGSPVPATGTLRWVCRLRIVRLFVVALVVGCLGFYAGRFVHQKMQYEYDMYGEFGRLSAHAPGMHDDHNQQEDLDTDSHKHGEGHDRPYLNTEYHDGIAVKRYRAGKYAADDPRHKQSMKELEERHAASRKRIEKQINQNLPNVHVNQQPDTQQHLEPEAAKQQQAAQSQNGANQPAPPQQHAAQQDTAKQQHAANQQPQQQNAQQQQPAAQLQQPNLPQAVANAAPRQTAANQQGVQKHSSDLHPKKPQVQDLPSDVNNYPYHIIQSLTNTHKMPHLKQRFIDCIKSILDKASINLHFFFVVDKPGREFITETLQKITDEGVAKNKFQFHFMDVDELAHQIAPLVTMLQAKVSKGNPYYQDAIFFLSVALHRGILPDYVHRVVMLDTDLKFMTDIKELFDYFGQFTGDNIMGLAREMQPVYRHMLSLYRSQNKGTKVGDPPPDGLTGFNSGVFLLDLDKIKASAAYRGYINSDKIAELTNKYFFKGHLGDQDFYSLISLDKPDLFYILPCSWNRQLCTWWKDKGYTKVFDLYFTCNEKIHVYHGNCNTPIPH